MCRNSHTEKETLELQPPYRARDRRPVYLFSRCSFAPIVHRPTVTDRRRSVNVRRGISAARHTAPAEGVPSLASALVKCCTARINYGNNGAF
jgi:hypothetical protein